MKSLQIKDLPEHIYLKLSQMAESERRSLAQQAILALAKGLDLEVDARARRAKVFARIQERKASEPKLRKKISDPVTLVREDRDR